MASITISCPHTCKIYPSCSSPKFFHTLKITYTYQKIESLYYGDDQIIDTPYIIPITDLVQSDPINPFCNECQLAFLDFFHNKCYSPFNNLENLRIGVRKEMDRLVNFKDTCACNYRPHGVVYTFEYILKRPITDEELDEVLELDQLDEVGGLVPASEGAIEAVETLDVEDFEEKVREESCSICLEGLVISETDDVNNNNNSNSNSNSNSNGGDVVIRRLARLPCQHMFHDECILKWLRNCHLCPLCRFELAVDESYDDDEEEEDNFLDAPSNDGDDDEEIFMNAFDRLLNWF